MVLFWAVPGKVEEAATAKDEAIGDSEFAQISTGGIRHYDTASDMEIELDEIADTIGLTVWTHNNRGAWFDLHQNRVLQFSTHWE